MALLTTARVIPAEVRLDDEPARAAFSHTPNCTGTVLTVSASQLPQEEALPLTFIIPFCWSRATLFWNTQDGRLRWIAGFLYLSPLEGEMP